MPKATSQKQMGEYGLLFSQGKISKAALTRRVKGLKKKDLPVYANKRKRKKK